jgi:hypothetical protein
MSKRLNAQKRRAAEGLHSNGEKQVPRFSRDDTGALAAIALAGLKTRHYNCGGGVNRWRA